jgi:hypothetical protein
MTDWFRRTGEPHNRGVARIPQISPSHLHSATASSIDRVRHKNELYETAWEATACHHGMRLVSGEQSKGVSCPDLLLLGNY